MRVLIVGRKAWRRKIRGVKCGAQSMGRKIPETQSMGGKVWGRKVGKPNVWERKMWRCRVWGRRVCV